jgi:hypothetical protein
MDAHAELLGPLLTGLSPDDQGDLLAMIQRAHGDQLHRKRHPRRRARRDADGILQMPHEQP